MCEMPRPKFKVVQFDNSPCKNHAKDINQKQISFDVPLSHPIIGVILVFTQWRNVPPPQK